MRRLGKSLSFILLMIAVAVLTLFFVFDASGKTVPAACNLNYTDISPSISQMLSNAHPFPSGHRFYEPKRLSERYILFITSDYLGGTTVTFYDYYLYDLGADGLLLTNDDRAVYITNNTVAQAPSTAIIPELYGMVDESAGVTRFYWTFYRYQNSSPIGSFVYRCTLNQGNCIQHQTVLSIQNTTPEIVDLVPLESQNRLYMVIAADTQWSFLNGHISSCSILPLNSTSIPTDHCSYGYSFFRNHTDYSTYSGIIKEKGIIYYNLTFSNSFFNVDSQTNIAIPQNTMGRSNLVTLLGNRFFTYRIYTTNANLTDFYAVKPTGIGNILKTYRTRIIPLLVENDISDVLYVYSRSKPGFYGQYIERFDGANWSNSQIYQSNSPVSAPMPLTVTNDGRVFAIRATPTLPVVKFYQSTCSG